MLFAVACVVSYLFSSHRGIYTSQRIGVAKGGDLLGRWAPSLDTSLHASGRTDGGGCPAAAAPAPLEADATAEPRAGVTNHLVSDLAP